MTRPRSPFTRSPVSRSRFPRTLLIIVVGTLSLVGLAGALIGANGLAETADPVLRPFVPVLDAVSAMLTGHDCQAARAQQAVDTVLATPTC
ncbi:MAG: hypothetical protein U5J97_11485 [Trueperaceae bacterium]|nr:hypothetical protein [Trueperaceae bacterium]